MIRIFVPGHPATKARPNEPKYLVYDSDIRKEATKAVNQARGNGRTFPVRGAVLLGAYFYLLTREEKKPDLSNLLKAVEDSLTGIIWKDDAQVVGYLPGTGKYRVSRPGEEKSRKEIVVVEADRLNDEQRTGWRSPTWAGSEAAPT